MNRRSSPRSLLTIALLALVGASLAGCLGEPEEATDATEADGLPTDVRESEVVTPAVGCTEPSDAPAGHSSSGSVHDDEVGTGFGDIGSPTSCIDNPGGGDTTTGQVEPHKPVQTYPDPQDIPSDEDAEPIGPVE